MNMLSKNISSQNQLQQATQGTYQRSLLMPNTNITPQEHLHVTTMENEDI